MLDGRLAGTLAAVGAQVFGGFKPADAGSHYARCPLCLRGLRAKPYGAVAASRWLVASEDYSDFGTNSAGKLASRFAFTKEFARAWLGQHRFPCAALGAAMVQLDGDEQHRRRAARSRARSRFALPIAKALGASALTPEKSTTSSLGFTSEPFANFSAYGRLLPPRRSRTASCSSSNYTGAAVADFLASRACPRSVVVATLQCGRHQDRGSRRHPPLQVEPQGSRQGYPDGQRATWARRKSPDASPPAAARGARHPTAALRPHGKSAHGKRSAPQCAELHRRTDELDKFTFQLREVRYGEVSAVALGNNGGIDQARPRCPPRRLPEVAARRSRVPGSAAPATSRSSDLRCQVDHRPRRELPLQQAAHRSSRRE